MLMHAYSGGVDHLDSAVMGSGKRVHDAATDTSSSPADEAVVARGVQTNAWGGSRQGAPERKIQKLPLMTRRSFTRGTPRGLLGSIGLMAVHS